MTTELNVLELFAGVGGFRVGLEDSSQSVFKTKWANQWEPSRKSQDAYEVYNYHFPYSENLNINIEDITDETFKNMHADIIVGGFPCQDYSVARSKKNEMGITGKKGVLFWQIIRATRIIKPKYLILENVDRLLKAPSSQRGRDFAIMLAAFNELGYSVEWRVINAAEYGRSQRRRRVFFFIYRNDLSYAKQLDQRYEKQEDDLLFDEHKYDEYIFKEGLFAQQFPVKASPYKNRFESYTISEDIVKVSNNFTGKVWNTGIMRHGKYYTIDTEPAGNEKPITLGEIIQNVNEVDKRFYLSDEAKLEKFKYLRGAKK